MTIQILISTMFQKDYSLLERMNIQTDAIVINQGDEDNRETFEYRGHRVLWISCRERGVGRSRNMAIENADADIILFADDDMVYYDNYGKAIIETFEQHPQVDMFAFQFDNTGELFQYQKDTQIHKLHLYNSLRYGTISFCCRRKSVIDSHIRFSLLFGGGAKYRCGEDSIFITDMIKKSLKVYAAPAVLGSNKQGESTWFKGFDKKYFYDKGILMYRIYGRKAYILAPVLVIRHPDWFSDLGLLHSIQMILKGVLSAKGELQC